MKQILLILIFFSIAGWGRAQEIDFNRQIRPLLSDNCFKCHGPDQGKRKADLRLDTEEGLRAELDDHRLITPGKPEESELYLRLVHEDEDERMPPQKTRLKLSSSEIELVKKWIAQGAKWQEHWSLRPLENPAPPKAEGSDWPLNPIDQFVLRGLRKEGFSPSAEEDKARLFRRLALDLTGLPPGLEELDSYLASEVPDAYAKAVDTLLDSPSYGERMAWDWLDLARYADTNGFQGDSTRSMWPWRDWVVRSLNANMPFDKFTVEQIAGDMLPDASLEQKLATGFCRNHMINGEGGRIAEENRVEYIFDQIETIGTVWMGLTVQCARCHDHKFDPLRQRDYYQLFAIFNQTPVNGGGRDPATPPVIRAPDSLQYGKLDELNRGIVDAALKVVRVEERLFTRAEGQNAAQSEVAKELPKKVVEALFRGPADRNPAQLGEIEKHYRESMAAYSALLKKLREQVAEREKLEKSFVRVMVMQDKPGSRKSFILDKGLYNQKREEVSAEVPQSLPALPEKAPRNRLSLARWLVDPSHPRTARVTVNRECQKFFGTGLVKTVEDLGAQGEKPTHPQLLDWLANEFIRSGWNLKALHRLIVTSATYRQSSATRPELLERDPRNRLLARQTRMRMEAETIRDTALAAAGLISDKIGGPGVYPPQPEGIYILTQQKKAWPEAKGEDRFRRCMYTYFWRSSPYPFLPTFDAPDATTTCTRRSRSNTPLQALTLANDKAFFEIAQGVALRILSDGPTPDSQRLRFGFRTCLSREPSSEELGTLSEFLSIQRNRFSQSTKAAAAVAPARRPEGVSAAEAAAWTAVSRVLVNLDEFITRE